MLSLTDFTNAGLEDSDRRDSWHEIGPKSLMPVIARSDADSDLNIVLRVLTTGDVQISRACYSSLSVVRTSRLIRQTDPEVYQVNLFLQGNALISHAGREAVLGPGQFVVLDSSQPFQATRSCAGDIPSYLLQLPRGSVLLPSDLRTGLIGMPFDARSGIAALFSQWLQGMLRRAHEFTPDQAAGLAAMTTDLFTTVVADSLRTADSTRRETPRWILRMRVDQFVDEHLGEPDLTPAVVAEAHHLSLRSLQQLFAATGDSPAAWIRRRRLERCARDLANPGLRHQHVHTIAARWGFTGQAHFSRLFRATYGMSPVEYRNFRH